MFDLVLLLRWNHFDHPKTASLLSLRKVELQGSCTFRKLWSTASSRMPTELWWKGKEVLPKVRTSLFCAFDSSLSLRFTALILILTQLLVWMVRESPIFLMLSVLYWELQILVKSELAISQNLSTNKAKPESIRPVLPSSSITRTNLLVQ